MNVLPTSAPLSAPIRRVTRRARTLRFATFLAPHLFWFYREVTRLVARRLGHPIELVEGGTYDELAEVDGAFVCGLAYIERGEALEAVAAPVPCGPRYDGRPVYYSDVVVHADSDIRTFADLRGRTWVYNEPYSHSGYGVARYHLACLGETRGYFGRVIEAGFHERALELIANRSADGAAVDSHALETLLSRRPRWARALRVITSLGPSPIQPFAVARRLPETLRARLRRAFLEIGRDTARRQLARARVDRFVAVADADYDPIRRMRKIGEACGLLTAHL